MLTKEICQRCHSDGGRKSKWMALNEREWNFDRTVICPHARGNECPKPPHFPIDNQAPPKKCPYFVEQSICQSKLNTKDNFENASDSLVTRDILMDIIVRFSRDLSVEDVVGACEDAIREIRQESQ